MLGHTWRRISSNCEYVCVCVFTCVERVYLSEYGVHPLSQCYKRPAIAYGHRNLVFFFSTRFCVYIDFVGLKCEFRKLSYFFFFFVYVCSPKTDQKTCIQNAFIMSHYTSVTHTLLIRLKDYPRDRFSGEE